MLEFMKLYDKANDKRHGKFKLSHLEIGKLLKCWTATDKYGNTYYRNLTSNMREHLVLGKDYIIEPHIKKQQGQQIWFMTKEALFVLAMLLRGSKPYRAELMCSERLQRYFQNYVLSPF